MLLRRVLRTLALAGAAGLALVAAAGSQAAAPAPPAVPVLMYHVVADPPPGAAYPELYVARRDFTRQMGWLARHGFHGVTLSAVYAYWFHERPLPAHPIVVSFDDGYRSQAVTAGRVLRSHRWPGVMNLEVRNTRDFWGMPPARMRQLIAGGWELAAHTIDHPDLRTLDDARLRKEVAGSRVALQRMFGVPVAFFCYPAGRYDARVVAAVRAAGYLGATTTDPGLATAGELFTLKRIRVQGSDGLAGFAAKIRALVPVAPRRSAG